MLDNDQLFDADDDQTPVADERATTTPESEGAAAAEAGASDGDISDGDIFADNDGGDNVAPGLTTAEIREAAIDDVTELDDAPATQPVDDGETDDVADEAVAEPVAAVDPDVAVETESVAAADVLAEAEAETSEAEPEAAPRRRRRAAVRPAGAPSALEAAFTAPVLEPEPATESVKPVVAQATFSSALALFQPPPDVPALPPLSKSRSEANEADEEADDVEETVDEAPDGPVDNDADDDDDAPKKKRRRRGGRRRRKPGGADGTEGESGESSDDADGDEAAETETEDAECDETAGSTRRRRRRRRTGSDASDPDDPPNTVVHVRQGRTGSDQVTSVKGSTRLEAKKQRRREGREAGRRRAPILTEAEFLARREAVDRVMVVRQQAERTQIAVLEDGVLAEHYVNRSVSTSMVGNVYLGRVQNVLPSMEAAFVDIGKGRNAVLYAGEVNWDAAGLEGQPKRIELAMKSGDSVLVQVTKDPVGHKGARLTSQVSLPGRYLVYVPGGSMTGISRRLPDRERTRLKKLLKAVLPEDSGVIVRTAAEGATEEQIRHDVERLTAQWEALSEKAKTGNAPELLHAEPDLATRVVRDIFNEDFNKLIVSGDRATSTIEDYVTAVAPDLSDRVVRWAKNEDVFAAHRIDEQLAKALDRKVWLPSGGSLVIDHTEAMTVVDVNTGKFTGQGGNLEETVTKNNLEAAEEIVRQLRLRDVGGIIVIDFIDMVLESNRDLVLRRLLECLGRDRTKHQVAEVTSLGLVQMTRKRIGQGLLETFSEPCECCNGRGVKVQMQPVDRGESAEAPRRRRRPAGPIPGAPIPGAPNGGVATPAEAEAPAAEGSSGEPAEGVEAESDAADSAAGETTATEATVEAAAVEVVATEVAADEVVADETAVSEVATAAEVTVDAATAEESTEQQEDRGTD